MHFPAARAGPTMQPDPLDAAMGIIIWLETTHFGRMPPILQLSVLESASGILPLPQALPACSHAIWHVLG